MVIASSHMLIIIFVFMKNDNIISFLFFKTCFFNYSFSCSKNSFSMYIDTMVHLKFFRNRMNTCAIVANNESAKSRIYFKMKTLLFLFVFYIHSTGVF